MRSSPIVRCAGSSLVGLWALVAIACAGAQPTPDENESQQERLKQALDLSLRGAQSYEFTLQTPSSAPLKFRPEPVLRWSNPERGEIYGNVFLWTDRGRPEVVGSLFKWYTPFQHASHEFESLSLGGVAAQRDGAQRDGAQVWQATSPAIELKLVPDAPAPAESPVRRLSQMRQLAQQFAARSTDREGMELQLRLLTQPIYRYERPEGADATSTEWSDGALFVFVQGTDPEVFLMLEAREHQGAPTWQFALARMNSIAFRVTYQDREVWSLPVLPWSDVSSHRGPYTSFYIRQP
jgi:hypothetical protein